MNKNPNTPQIHEQIEIERQAEGERRKWTQINAKDNWYTHRETHTYTVCRVFHNPWHYYAGEITFSNGYNVMVFDCCWKTRAYRTCQIFRAYSLLRLQWLSRTLVCCALCIQRNTEKKSESAFRFHNCFSNRRIDKSWREMATRRMWRNYRIPKSVRKKWCTLMR